MQRIRFVIFALLSFGLVSGNPKEAQPDREAPFAPVSLDAADSLLATLTLEEKIQQFFVVRTDTFSNHASNQLLPFAALLQRSAGDTPFPPTSLIGIDLLHDTLARRALHLVSPAVLASTQNPDLVHSYAYRLGSVLKGYGVDFVIGPSLDIEYASDSPYTLGGTFGTNPDRVAEMATAYVEGLRSAGIVAVAGSFPGLGNTTRGFEQAPPTVYSKRSDFNGKDLVPYKALINKGVQAILVAQAFVPGLDSSLNTTASYSNIVHSRLRNDLGFGGITWSDLTPYGNDMTAQSILQAALTGNDMMITTSSSPERVGAIKSLIDQGSLSMEQVDIRCKRILQLKLWAERNHPKGGPEWITDRKVLLELKAREAYSAGITLLKNDDVLPITRLDSVSIAVLKIGAEHKDLSALVQRYAPSEAFSITFDHLENEFQEAMQQVKDVDHVLVMVDEEQRFFDLKRNGMSQHVQSIIARLVEQKAVSLIWNGDAKALRWIENHPNLRVVMAGQEVQPWSDDLLLQAYFGGRAINGSLQRHLPDHFQGEALRTEKIRLAYGLPEEVGIDRNDLKKIDSIAKKGIEEMAYPGCQVWFAKDGVVVVNEAFGHHTYQQEQAVQTTDLYDLASITKIAGSVAALMKLDDAGLFDLDRRLCDYLGEWVDTTEYMQLSMREILAHQAGLTPWIPFYSKTVTKGVPHYDVYSLAPSETYPLRVAREFYIRGDYPDRMFRQILRTKLNSEKTYKYSDIGYYFALRIIEKQSGMPLEEFVDATYYRPLGLATMGYRPLNRFDKHRITPTEFDQTFRGQLIHGDVHDPGAAMLGGVGGHAGLFSNANDLGVMMQMFLDGGSYGGRNYIDSATINAYTRCQYCDNDNRRGAGFDKPLREGSNGPSCGCTSLEAFGHQGFTGTVTWADPEEHVAYVFLSNRIYPNANNKKLAELNIRTDIQDVFYTAIEHGKELASDADSSEE